ncbi:3-hydroxyacyl-CoA dehydrogenase NAD-binding domain-containing protein [Microbulbifer sp.]|uniref:3-hydroxyacyl-CoA dehydrogenase NAD-binding domain-containing protein n=1 Tax=Microbulbifer sp. TaxID=1908541 RepID=UPI003F3423E3
MSEKTKAAITGRHGAIGQIMVSNPPVNAINYDMRVGLASALEQMLEDDSIEVILIGSVGTHFMAGVDISEFSGEMRGATLQEIQARIENAPKPVVVTMQGMALGGGLELALACHYRLADEKASLGLPEITLGLIPGAGGTQRLPRLIGALPAFEMMLSGRPMNGREALAGGLVDEVITGDLHAGALAFCETLIGKNDVLRPTRERSVSAESFTREAIAGALKTNARALKGRTTQNLLLKALEAAVEQPFADAMRVEARLAEESLAARESQALRHLFFAERNAGKLKNKAATLMNDKVPGRAAVIGAGTMGSGIATALANAGLSVVLIDNTEEGLQRGLSLVRGNYASHMKRGRITQEQVDARLARISGSVDMRDAAGVDFVVEAVFENFGLKQNILKELDALLPANRLIATNTSTLSVSDIAAATTHPERIAGLHFFSPAHVMKLVEVVRGAQTSDQALASALQAAKLLKKIPVITGDRFGFVGNKMMLDGYFREAELLMLEGASPAQVDGALEAFGFAMGPQRVNDLGGTDVGTKARRELYKRETREDPYFVIADKLTELDRLGQKTHAGFYRYEEGSHEALADPEVAEIIKKLAAERKIPQRDDITDEEIRERCLLALINVGAQVLEQTVAASAADIDVVWTSGYGFPRYHGGPMFYADSLGLKHVAERVRHYHGKLGHYWRPSALLEQLADSDSSFQQWDRSQ